MFWRIKRLSSGVLNPGLEEWCDNILYKRKESANECLEQIIAEFGFTRVNEEEIQKVGDMCRVAYRIEKFYLKEYIIIE
jgi:hypothetical protein